MARHSTCDPYRDFCTGDLTGLQSFDDLQASRFACHPDRSYRRVSNRLGAAVAFTSEHLTVCYLPVPRASRPNRAIDGVGTHTPPDSRPCRPLPRRYLCESFPACLDPYPGGPRGAFTPFFPQGVGLPRSCSGSALHKILDSHFSPGGLFGAAAISSCSGPPVCLPPRCKPGQNILYTSAEINRLYSARCPYAV